MINPKKHLPVFKSGRMKIGGMMRSMRNVAVGLLVAAAVAVCPVIASADDQVNGVPGGGE